MTTENKTVLLTGGTGFLGTIILKNLSQKGYLVKTLGRSQENDIQCDLAREVPALKGSFDWVVHNAGKAHVVPKSSAQAQDFFDTNVKGTQHLLQALDQTGKRPESIVFISSIAVYGLTFGENISEQHPLSATDPYGKSKIEAEQLITSWSKTNHVNSALLRLPLLAGPNAPGNLGAMVSGIRRGFYFGIDGSKARRSMVMAGDVADIIPHAARTGGIYNLTDGHHPSFKELEDVIAKQLGIRSPRSLSFAVARLMALAGDLVDNIFPGKAPVTTKKVQKIISTLTFDDQKARRELGWKPRSVIDALTI